MTKPGNDVNNQWAEAASDNLDLASRERDYWRQRALNAEEDVRELSLVRLGSPSPYLMDYLSTRIGDLGRRALVTFRLKRAQ